MKAKVKKSARFPLITSCAGKEFVRYEYREVPAGFEQEAENNPFLDVEKGKVSSPSSRPSTAPHVSGEVNATGAAVELAAESDVDLSEVSGSMAGGRISKGDVVKYIKDMKEG